MSDETLIRDLLSKEEDAVSSYVKAAEECTNLDVRKVLLDISKEEAVHKGELITLLKLIGVCDNTELKQGEEEVINKVTPKSSVIKEIMSNWEKTGKIGNSIPENKQEALKQAVAIVYSTKK